MSELIPASTSPLWARIVGGAAGALCFGLCVLLLGSATGVGIAIVAALIARLRRTSGASLPFAAAAAICAIAFLSPPIAIALASLAFGAGLALASRLRPAALSI